MLYKILTVAGLEVEMFDPEFQDIIYAENKEFLDQAKQRAAEVKKPKAVELSPLEKPVAAADLTELSDEALTIYSNRSGMNLPIDGVEFLAHLQQRQLIELDSANILRPTGLGILLFGKTPRNRYPQAVLKVQARFGNAEPEIHDFADALVLLPEQVESLLKKVLTSTISREAFAREIIYDYPITVLREAIINAIVHRDYDIEGAKIYLNIDDEKIVVKSPGLPVKPIKLEDVQQFKAPSLSRNPKLMAVFNAMNLVEERGMGMDEMKSLPDNYHLPRPSVTWEDPYLVITFPRSKAFMGNIVKSELLSQLNEEEKTGLFYIRDRQTISKPDYAHKFYFSDKKAQRHLTKFIELGLVEAIGNGPSRRFRYIENR